MEMKFFHLVIQQIFTKYLLCAWHHKPIWLFFKKENSEYFEEYYW